MKITTLSKKAGVHPTTLYKAKAGLTFISPKLAEKLESITGIERCKWIWPKEYGDPWKGLKRVK
ncbi:hypothetical protein DSLASN_01730 [Desulfoluna limicola]|uniref:Uncharacterized protein n=1 Tax=Desulfoluna limicola TaxID=2810562 RepID=A0ABN6EY70_9BACT|nr:hypothetical protein DSLASN_01730 [Desulfoluna limicola]